MLDEHGWQVDVKPSTGDEEYLSMLRPTLNAVLQGFKPDLV